MRREQEVHESTGTAEELGRSTLGPGTDHFQDELDPIGRRQGDQRLRPDRAFQPQRDGQRLLQMSAARHHRTAVLFRLPGQSPRHAGKLGADQGQAFAHLEHGGGVHDILRGGAPVGPAAGLARARLLGVGEEGGWRTA